MKNNYNLPILAAFVITLGLTSNLHAQTFGVWTLDVHSKIFSDSQPAETKNIAISAASNEFESAQFAIRSSVDQPGVTITPSALTCEKQGKNRRFKHPHSAIGALHITKTRNKPMKLSSEKRPVICLKSCTTKMLSLKADETMGIWVTVFVPTSLQTYVGSIAIRNENIETELPPRWKSFPLNCRTRATLYDELVESFEYS